MRIVFYYVALLILLISCDIGKHVYYVPPTQQVPLFKERNEFRFSADLGIGEDAVANNIQTAVSISDRYALMASFQSFGRKSNSNYNGQQSNSYNATSFDIAFGFFKPHLKRTVFEVYGGLGWLSQKHNYVEDSVYYTTSNWGWFGTYTTQHTVWLNRGSARLGAFNYFIQTQYGFRSKYFEAAISVRFTDLYFSVVDNKVVPFYKNGYEEVERFLAFRNSLLFEPAITLRAGGNNIKFQLQVGLSGFIMNDFRSETQLFSFGLFFQPK